MKEAVRRRLVWLAVVCGVILAVWVKVRLEAGAALERAQALEERGSTQLAIVVYRHTIRWYSPGSAPVEAAVERLWALGKELEEKDPATALSAYRALRSGLLAIRSLWDPYADRIPPANDRIAALMAVAESRDGTPGEAALAASEAHHRALLDTDHAPHRGWSLLAVLAFLLWVFALFRLAVRGFDDESGALQRSPALQWGAIALVAMAGWAVGLAFA